MTIRLRIEFRSREMASHRLSRRARSALCIACCYCDSFKGPSEGHRALRDELRHGFRDALAARDAHELALRPISRGTRSAGRATIGVSGWARGGDREGRAPPT